MKKQNQASDLDELIGETTEVKLPDAEGDEDFTFDPDQKPGMRDYGFEEGNYRLEIVGSTKAESKAGNKMAVVEFEGLNTPKSYKNREYYVANDAGRDKMNSLLLAANVPVVEVKNSAGHMRPVRRLAWTGSGSNLDGAKVWAKLKKQTDNERNETRMVIARLYSPEEVSKLNFPATEVDPFSDD